MSTLTGVAGTLPLPLIATIANPGTGVSSADQAVTAHQLLNMLATLEAQINGSRRTLILDKQDLSDADHTLYDPTVTGGKQQIRMLTSPGAARTIVLPQPTAWVGSTAYTTTAPDFVTSDTGKLYQCITNGSSDAFTGPTGTGSNIVDGTAHWAYKGVAPIEGDWYRITVFVAASAFAVQVRRSVSSEYLAFLGPGSGSRDMGSALVRFNGTKWKLMDCGGAAGFFGDESSDP